MQNQPENGGLEPPAEPVIPQEIQDESVARLKALRGANRGVLTRLENESLELIEKSENGEEINFEGLTTIDRLLEDKLKIVSSYNAAILEKISVEEIEHEVDEAYEIELRIGETRTKLKNFLKKDRQPTRTPYVPFEQASGYILHRSPFSSPFRERTHVSAKPKLPKISLKRFNGDLIKFYPFWESFESTVHNNEQLSAVDKFNYLHSLLDRAAASSIQGLPLTEENYENAVEILKDRLGRKQQIISAHMEELLKLQNCPNENASQFRQIYDKINIQVRGLEALDVTADK